MTTRPPSKPTENAAKRKSKKDSAKGKADTNDPPAAGKPELASTNPFDPANLRMTQNFASSLSVKKVHNTVPYRKPNRHEWVRVLDGEGWPLETVVFEDKVLRETYLVDQGILPDLFGEIVPVSLFLAVNRLNDPIIWPVKLPGEDGRTNSWNQSALEATKLAKDRWTRVASNTTAGYYETFVTEAELPAPQWPDLTMIQLLEICFRDKFIRNMDHPAIKRLRGEL